MKYCNCIIFCILIQLISADKFLKDHMKQKNNHLITNASNPLTDVWFGGILIAAAFAMLWYNERRQAITEYRLNEAKKNCISINLNEININNNNKLVHLNGKNIITQGNSMTDGPMVDLIFGISLSNCIKLERQVEMLQFQERMKQENGRTVYYYDQVWSDMELIGGIDHQNDNSKWIIKSEKQSNLQVYLGSYLIGNSLIDQINNKQKISMNLSNSQAAANYFNKQLIFKNFDAQGEYMYFQQNPGISTVNDLRVRFYKTEIGPTTIVSQQMDNRLDAFIVHDKFDQTIANSNNNTQTLNCLNCCCYCFSECKKLQKPLTEINWIETEILTLDQIFKLKANNEICLTNTLRISGYIMMGLGFFYIFSPITWVLYWFPLLGEFLSAITGLIFFLFSFILSLPLTILTIAFAWIFYHPKYGIALIIIACGISTGLFFYIKNYQIE